FATRMIRISAYRLVTRVMATLSASTTVTLTWTAQAWSWRRLKSYWRSCLHYSRTCLCVTRITAVWCIAALRLTVYQYSSSRSIVTFCSRNMVRQRGHGQMPGCLIPLSALYVSNTRLVVTSCSTLPTNVRASSSVMSMGASKFSMQHQAPLFTLGHTQGV